MGIKIEITADTPEEAVAWSQYLSAFGNGAVVTVTSQTIAAPPLPIAAEPEPEAPKRTRGRPAKEQAGPTDGGSAASAGGESGSAASTPETSAGAPVAGEKQATGGEAPTAANDEPAVDLAALRKMLQEVASDCGIAATRELLGKFGVSKISAIDPKDYQAFVEAGEAMRRERKAG